MAHKYKTERDLIETCATISCVAVRIRLRSFKPKSSSVFILWACSMGFLLCPHSILFL